MFTFTGEASALGFVLAHTRDVCMFVEAHRKRRLHSSPTQTLYKHVQTRASPLCHFVVSSEGPPPEREAGRDGDLPRYFVQAGGHAPEVLR